MASLVGNGISLLRRANSLVRTPIYTTVTLQPDDMAYYSIAGEYNKSGWPTGGFRETPTNYGNDLANEKLVDAFFYGFGNQIWRHVEGGLPPPNIFYSGEYSTYSAPYDYSESYEQFGAYHFTLPEKYKDSEVLGLRWTVQHRSTIICNLAPYSQQKNNFFSIDYASKGSSWSFLKDSGWDVSGWEHNVGLFSNLNNNIAQMYSQCQSTVILDEASKSGSPTGYEMLWTGRQDGMIPLASIPYNRTYVLDGSMTSFFNANKGGWIVAIPPHERGENLRPAFTAEYHLLYWLCTSFRTLELGVDIKVAD